MADFKPEIKKILDKNKDRFALEPSSLDDEFDKREREDRARDFYLMNRYLIEGRDSIDEDDAEQLKKDIADKLAVSSLDRVGRNDWWWKPANGSVTGTLEEVQRALEKMTASNTRKWTRKLRLAWKVIAELIYLVIVLALF